MLNKFESTLFPPIISIDVFCDFCREAIELEIDRDNFVSGNIAVDIDSGFKFHGASYTGDNGDLIACSSCLQDLSTEGAGQ